MKNYRMLVPVILVVFYFLSIYSLNDTKVTKIENYETYLSEAHSFREMDIRVDADAYYMMAYDLIPSVQLAIEIGEYYLETNRYEMAFEWAEDMVEKYPKDPLSYEYLIDFYMKQRDYAACFSLLTNFEKRSLVSEHMMQCKEEISGKFFLTGAYYDVGSFSASMCPVYTERGWGFVNSRGSTMISPQFEKVGAFTCRYEPSDQITSYMASVVDKNGEAYFIDSKGNKKFIIKNVENVVELGMNVMGIYQLFDGNTWGFYDESYALLFGGFEEVSAFSSGYAAVKKDGKWSIVNTKGQDVIGKTFDDICMDENLIIYKNGRFFVNDGNGYQMIDVNGNTYGSVYEDVKLFAASGEYAAVKINGMWGFVDSTGTIMIEPQYEDARSFCAKIDQDPNNSASSLAAVRIGEKWGYIDRNGKFIIEPQFVDAKDFNSSGCAFVSSGDAWQLLKFYKYNY